MDTLNQIQGRRCFITGGRGFIGKSLTKKLTSLGAKVSAPTKSEMDITHALKVNQEVQIAQPEILFHLAATSVVNVSNPLSTHDINVLGTSNLISAVKSLKKTPIVILMGSGFEYKTQESPLLETDPLESQNTYGLSKITAAHEARRLGQGLSVNWIRLFNSYGPDDVPSRLLPYIVNQARAGLPIEVTDGGQIRDFTYVDDVAEGLIRLALSAENSTSWEEFNMGSGQPIYLKNYIELIKEILAEFNIVADIRYGAKSYRPGEAMNMTPDITRLQKKLGWRPSTPIKEGIRNTVQFILSTSK
ncbi:MAG: NAD-dependent epimerase/dehydratase family protein [Opitutae bacterium]